MKVADLFKANLFPDFKLLAGKRGLENEICTIFVLDSPDFCQWVRGGELVIGNGYAFHNNPNEFPVFLKELASKNAAALGMKFDRFRFADNYNDIIQLANKYDLPLFEIPFKYTWNSIYDEIYRHSRIMSNSHSIGSLDLLTVIEERMDPLDLAYSLHAKVKRDLFVYSGKLQLAHNIDNSFEVASSNLADEFRRATLIDHRRHRHIGSISISTQSKFFNGVVMEYTSYKICGIEICVKLHKRESALPPQEEKIVINTLLIFYLMVMDEVLTIDLTRQKMDSLMERILLGRHSDACVIRDQFRELHLQFPLPCVLLIFYKEDLALMPRELQLISPFSCILGEQMIMVMSLETFEEKLTLIHEIAVQNDILGIHSRTVSNMTDISPTFSALRYNMSWMEKHDIHAGFYSHSDLLVRIGVARFSELREFEQILEKYWMPLTSAGKKRSVSLQSFAATMIDNNFNLAKTASDLSIHYNTARNYYEEIGHTLDVDLETSETRLALMLSRNVSKLRSEG